MRARSAVQVAAEEKSKKKEEKTFRSLLESGKWIKSGKAFFNHRHPHPKSSCAGLLSATGRSVASTCKSIQDLALHNQPVLQRRQKDEHFEWLKSFSLQSFVYLLKIS